MKRCADSGAALMKETLFQPSNRYFMNVGSYYSFTDIAGDIACSNNKHALFNINRVPTLKRRSQSFESGLILPSHWKQLILVPQAVVLASSK